MAEQKSQLESLMAENEVLHEQIEKLEKEVAKREYHQGLKQRPFWIRMPSIWFNIAESEFQVAGVMDDMTKYNYVVSQLDEEMADKVKDITSNPPVRGKYLILKQALIQRLADPEHERFRQLFDEELEDKTPSQFYRHLLYLAGANVTTDKILLHLWLRRLPQHCQEILASRPEQSNLKLTELADNILEATKVAEESKSTKNSIVDYIQQSVDELSKQVVTLGATVKSQQSRTRTRNTSTTSPQILLVSLIVGS